MFTISLIKEHIQGGEKNPRNNLPPVIQRLLHSDKLPWPVTHLDSLYQILLERRLVTLTFIWKLSHQRFSFKITLLTKEEFSSQCTIFRPQLYNILSLLCALTRGNH